ncbi:MAG TPA: hypothetical protein DEB06_03395 [Phycisphaerales bacterium]|nr:hypothetical protein [Phycisphaerales bacterium]
MPREGSPDRDRIRVQHMLDAARDVMGFVSERTRADLDSDAMLVRAVSHAILEIGEAAARTTDAGRARASHLPWGQIVGMRNVLVHVYWAVDRDRLWRTATEDVPVLVSLLEDATRDWPLEESGPSE